MKLLDKKPLESKKFVFALITLLSLLGIMITALVTQTFVWPMAAFMAIAVAGLVAIGLGYVLGQGSLDKWANIVTPLSKIRAIETKQEKETDDKDSGKDLE